MPSYALLLAHDEYPSPTTEWPSEPGGNCDGWAEWFSTTPLLFSLLLGDAQHLPELVACSAYEDKEALSALAAPMAGVKARWHWLLQQLGKLPAHWPESTQTMWQQIDATITNSKRQCLLLDCATLSEYGIGEPGFLTFLQTLRNQSLLWDCSASTLPEALQKLKQSPASELGWWSPNVIARTQVIKVQEQEDWPSWLADHYESPGHLYWEAELDAYYVTPKLHPCTGLPPQNEQERDDWPMGLVTPYGRWLQHPKEGARYVFPSAGYINVHYPETTPTEGAPSGLKDLNGVWALSPSAGYRDVYALTPFVMMCKSAHSENREDLRSLPALELLHEAVFHVTYNAEEDDLIRASKGDTNQSQALLLNTYGQPLFDSNRYETIHAFNAKTGLAVACVRMPYTDIYGNATSRIYEGVVHLSGQEIVPCEFELVERGFSSSPPKILPSGKLLAFTHHGEPRIFNTQGKLLAQPDLWCAPLNRHVKKTSCSLFVARSPTQKWACSRSRTSASHHPVKRGRTIQTLCEAYSKN